MKSATKAMQYEDSISLHKQNKNEGTMTKEQKKQFKQVMRVTDITKLSLGQIQWYVFKKFVTKHKFGLMTAFAIFEFCYFTNLINMAVSAFRS